VQKYFFYSCFYFYTFTKEFKVTQFSGKRYSFTKKILSLLDKLFISLKNAILRAELPNGGLPDSGFRPDWVKIGTLPTDANLDNADEKLYLTLVNIEEERVTKNQLNTRRDPSDPSKFIVVNPEIKLNAYILATAYFPSYTEALKRIAYVIRVFQQKNVFSPAEINELLDNNNDTPPILDQVIVDLFSQSLDQQYQFSQSYGSKQIPSIIYKVRLLVIDELPAEPPQMPAITTIGVAVNRM
jgi:Pvc16 N-terminal domain